VWGLDLQTGFFAELADHALLRAFAWFELTAEAIPFAKVDIIRTLGAVEHEGMPGVLEVAKSGEDHSSGAAS
jgi:hypothetical protein